MKALWKRFDMLIAAILCGVAVVPIASSFLCREWSCRSGPDELRFYGLGAVTAAIAGAVFCRIRYPFSRVVILGTALYAAFVVPSWAERHGRWWLPVAKGNCLVLAGAAPEEVHRACGEPAYWCRGPKNIDSNPWNPFTPAVCGFSGDVYGDRLVTYNCDGLVANVVGFDTGAESRPARCLTWGHTTAAH